ncbi:MAG: hypothetical protein P8Q35_06690 [Candidatus Thalassarchaeaceae archaeon]|nr:hypothetical protein [Candidatus Thalassarchaeaceae archaeon]
MSMVVDVLDFLSIAGCFLPILYFLYLWIRFGWSGAWVKVDMLWHNQAGSKYPIESDEEDKHTNKDE